MRHAEGSLGRLQKEKRKKKITKNKNFFFKNCVGSDVIFEQDDCSSFFCVKQDGSFFPDLVSEGVFSSLLGRSWILSK